MSSRFGFLFFLVVISVLPVHAQERSSASAVQRAIARQDTADWNAVIHLCDEAIRRNPTDGNAYGERGIAWFEVCRFAEAKADLNKALGLNPNSPRWLTKLGIVHAEEGDWSLGYCQMCKQLVSCRFG